MGWCLEEDLLRVRENKDRDRALKDDSDWENFPGMGIHKSRKGKKKKKRQETHNGGGGGLSDQEELTNMVHSRWHRQCPM